MDPGSRDLEEALTAAARLIDDRLDLLLPPVDATPAELHEAIRYSALAPGKRMRPALVVACAGVFGGNDAALDAACAVEMVHCFSLIHDDLPAIDNDDLRRGLPTSHMRFGEAVAILAGDALFSLAFETIAGLAASPDRIVRVMRELTKATGPQGLVGGETLDILSEGIEISEETLREIHAKKTGSLIAASCTIGAILAAASDDDVETMRRYGLAVGLAFQIADDVLNETSTPEALGKATATDRDRKKATYPALYGVEGSRTLALAAAQEAEQSLAGLSSAREDSRGLLRGIARFAVERLR